MDKKYTLEMAQIAKDSYNKYFDLKYDVVYSGGVSNSQFHILHRDNLSIVATTGSNQFKDWVSNVMVRRVNNTHRGFLRDFREVYPLIHRILTDLATDKLICVGHSYGGALSNLIALEFAKQYMFENIELYTFGCPRLFNKELALQIDSFVPFHKRFANKWDIVTKIPFGFNYKHAGTVIKFPKGKHSIDDYIKNLS